MAEGVATAREQLQYLRRLLFATTPLHEPPRIVAFAMCLLLIRTKKDCLEPAVCVMVIEQFTSLHTLT